MRDPSSLRRFARMALLMALTGGGISAQPPEALPLDASATRTFHLYATDGYHTTADGEEVYIWGYSLERVPGSATLPGPTLEVDEGDLVEITLTNLGPSRAGVHRFPHTIHLHGLDVDQANDGVPETGPTARVGERLSYRFRATHAGTYWYHCHVDTVEHLTMGMYGALVVHPADGPGRAWTGGPPYDRSYTLVLSEYDPAWGAAIGANRDPERVRFDPRYFFINGRSFPDTMDHADTHLRGHLGERVLVRLVNAGYGWRSMHLHGFHFDVVATDGRPLPQPYQKDTLSIGPGERYDIMVTLDQLGSYPFHSHVILDNTNDGAYPGGIHTMLSVVETGEPLERPHPAGHASEAPQAKPEPRPTERPGALVTRSFGGFPLRRPAADATAAPDGPRRDDDGDVGDAHGVSPAGRDGEASDGPVALVDLHRDRFRPEFLFVEAGTTVTWVNHDPRTHSIGVPGIATHDIGRNERWSHTFEVPGVYRVECVNHRGMTGLITVR
jgi:manganese oxidase